MHFRHSYLYTNITVVLSTSNPEPATTESTPTWPVETNLFFTPGVTKLMLTIQRSLICTVIQDTIEVL